MAVAAFLVVVVDAVTVIVEDYTIVVVIVVKTEQIMRIMSIIRTLFPIFLLLQITLTITPRNIKNSNEICEQ